MNVPEPPTGGGAEVTMSPEAVFWPVPQTPESPPQGSPGNDRLHHPLSGAFLVFCCLSTQGLAPTASARCTLRYVSDAPYRGLKTTGSHP